MPFSFSLLPAFTNLLLREGTVEKGEEIENTTAPQPAIEDLICWVGCWSVSGALWLRVLGTPALAAPSASLVGAMPEFNGVDLEEGVNL